MVALALTAARRPTLPWNVLLSTEHLLAAHRPLCWEAAYFLFPVLLPPQFIPFNNCTGSSFPSSKDGHNIFQPGC